MDDATPDIDTLADRQGNGVRPVVPVAALVDASRDPRKAKAAGAKLVKLARIQAAVDLRRAGETYSKIAAQLNCSTVYAHRLVLEGVKLVGDRTGEDSRVIKTMIVQRMDHATMKLMTMLDNKKDPPDTPTVLQIIDRLGRLDERRARLEGLVDGEQQAGPVQINVAVRTHTAERMAPLLSGMTLDEKREMLRLIEVGEARAAEAAK